MPELKTISSKITWQSDDGKVKKYQLIAESDGKQFQINTYSGKIAAPGWQGEVEKYEKKGDYYVRQPKQEGFNQSTGQTSQKKTYGKTEADYDSIYWCNALNAAVAFAKADNTTTDYVLGVAREFYAARPDKKSSSEASLDPTPSWDKAREILAKPAPEVDNLPGDDYDPNEPVDLSDIPF